MGKHSSGRNGFSFLAPACCPHCGGTEFRKDGIQCGKQRRRCHGCGRTFVPTTGTMLSKTRKRQEKWKRFVVEFTNDATLIASHEYGSVNKNTARLWRLKIMKCLGRLVSKTVLSGTVWIDEVYFDVPEKDKTVGENGIFLRGISRDKVCAELAIDSSGKAYASVMGTGKPASAMILAALRGHVAPGSLIVHDRFRGHGGMLRELGLEDVSPGSQEPGCLKIMQTANRFCALAKRVCALHLGIGRGHLQDCLDWACFRQRLRAVPKSKRREYVPKLCASTGVDFVRPRRSRRRKARRPPQHI
jgi:transposase-like protein